MKPSAGSIITTKGAVSSNGTDEAPAIITRVWGDKDPAVDGKVLVNSTVFPDCGDQKLASSIPLFETRAEALAEQERVNAIGDNRAMFRQRGMSGPMVAFWPDRV